MPQIMLFRRIQATTFDEYLPHIAAVKGSCHKKTAAFTINSFCQSVKRKITSIAIRITTYNAGALDTLFADRLVQSSLLHSPTVVFTPPHV